MRYWGWRWSRRRPATRRWRRRRHRVPPLPQLQFGPPGAPRHRRAARAPLDDGDDLRLLQRRRPLQRVPPVPPRRLPHHPLRAARAAPDGGGRGAPPDSPPPRPLPERLEQLETAGIVERRLTPSRPPHTEYTLTPRGERVAQAVAGLL